MHAINQATTRIVRGLPRETGIDSKGNLIVRLQLKNSGRGYKPNKKDPQNPKVNEKMSGIEINFDQNNPDRPFTAFPVD